MPPSLTNPPKPSIYIAECHETALTALVEGRVLPDPQGHTDGRIRAVALLKSFGYEWPPILDEPYPEVGEKDGEGVKYEQVTIE